MGEAAFNLPYGPPEAEDLALDVTDEAVRTEPAPVEHLADYRRELNMATLREVLDQKRTGVAEERTVLLLDYTTRLVTQDDAGLVPDELAPHMPVDHQAWLHQHWPAVKRIGTEDREDRFSELAYLLEDTARFDGLPWLQYARRIQSMLPLDSEPRWADTAIRLMLLEAHNQL